MRFGDEVTCFVVNLGSGWVERQTQISLDGSHGRAHLVTGGGDELGLFSLLGALFGNVAEHDDDTFLLWADWRTDDSDR